MTGTRILISDMLMKVYRKLLYSYWTPMVGTIGTIGTLGSTETPVLARAEHWRLITVVYDITVFSCA